jgi:glycosyltransferase involved in cell wall biosynthesis
MPIVSVIVPNYNHARFLRKRIDTILGQTFQDFELILLDDCSTDDSRSILSRYAGDPRVTLEFNKVNSGSTFKQWNKGVKLAHGKYVWIAESDDYADERLLERLVAVLNSDPTAAFAYCRSWRVTEDDRKDGFGDFYLTYLNASRWTIDYCADGHDECRDYFIHQNTVPNASGVVLSREIYERVGGADESLRLCGDWKLWAAMALQGRIAYVGEPLNYHRFHGASVRNKSLIGGLDVTEKLQVIRWILEELTPTETAREKLCQTLSGYWVPAIVTTRPVALGQRWAILRNARAIDPLAIRRLIRGAFVALRLKILKDSRFVRPGA